MSKALKTLQRLRDEGKLEASSSNVERSEPATIPLVDIIADPDQPRKVFDESKLASLAKSIKTYGVLQAITVKKIPSSSIGKDQYQIVMGERRYRAAKEAGLKEIPARVQQFDGDLSAVQVVENVHREDLTTFEIAKAIEVLSGDGHRRDEIAVIVGKSASVVSGYSKILQMPEEFRILAQQNVPSRALNDLYKLHQQEPTIVAKFIRDTAPENITRTSVEALKPETGEGAGEQKEGIEPTTEDNKVDKTSKAVRLVMVCETSSGEIGKVVTNKAPSSPDKLFLDVDGHEIEISIRDLTLVRMQPA